MAKHNTIQLYATGSATGTSVAQITIPAAGHIKSVISSLCLDSVTDNASVRLELSKVPANQIGTNGALDPFLEIGVQGNFVTSGLSQPVCNNQFAVDIQCRQGEIIYLHATVGGTATYTCNFIFIYG